MCVQARCPRAVAALADLVFTLALDSRALRSAHRHVLPRWQSHRRPLSAYVSARPRRHGLGVEGRSPDAWLARGGEAHRGEYRGLRRGGGSLRARGPGCCSASEPPRRSDPRLWNRRRRSVPRDGAARRGKPGRPHRPPRKALTRRNGAGDDARGARGGQGQRPLASFIATSSPTTSSSSKTRTKRSPRCSTSGSRNPKPTRWEAAPRPAP